MPRVIGPVGMRASIALASSSTMARTFFLQRPLRGERLGNHPHVAAVRHQDIVVRVALDLREFLDAFVPQGRVAQKERIKIGHQDRHLERAMQYIFCQHRDRVAFAAPDKSVFYIESVIGQARRRIGKVRFIQAVHADRANVAVLIEVVPHGEIKLGRRVERSLGKIGCGHRPALAGRFRRAVGNGHGARAQFLVTALLDRDAEFLHHPLRRLVFPPVKALEDRRLLALPRDCPDRPGTSPVSAPASRRAPPKVFAPGHDCTEPGPTRRPRADRSSIPSPHME